MTGSSPHHFPLLPVQEAAAVVQIHIQRRKWARTAAEARENTLRGILEIRFHYGETLVHYNNKKSSPRINSS